MLVLVSAHVEAVAALSWEDAYAHRAPAEAKQLCAFFRRAARPTAADGRRRPPTAVARRAAQGMVPHRAGLSPMISPMISPMTSPMISPHLAR